MPQPRTEDPGVPRTIWLVLFFAAFIVGGYQFLRPEGLGFGFGQGFETGAIARDLAFHGVYGNPFAPAVTGPTATVPPLYPLFLAALLKLLRQPGLIVPLAGAVNVAANATIAALMPRLSRVFYNNVIPGIFAGALWILTMRLMPQWDVSFTITGLILFCLLTSNTGGVTGPVGQPLAAGVLAGVLSLLNPAALLVCVPWVLFVLVSRQTPAKMALRYLGLFLLIVAACNLPWLVRNYRLWGTLVVRTNFGMTVYSSNNPCAESSLAKNINSGCYERTHPVASPDEIRLLQKLGEVAYDRRRTADAIEWIRHNPARFHQLTLARIMEFWFPDPAPASRPIYTIWAISILSIPGIVWMALRREPVTAFVVLVWLVYPPLYYLVVSADRYRYPILWTSLLPAGYFLTMLLPASVRKTLARSS